MSRAYRNAVTFALFCLGFSAMLVQVVFLREMLVMFFGNELCIGTILASWFAGIGAGALCARFARVSRAPPERRRAALARVMLVMAVALPAQLYAARVARLVLAVPPGEYASFAAVLGSAVGLLLPTALGVGFAFPVACQLLWLGSPRAVAGGVSAVGRAYTVESLGSMIGGAILSFVLLPLMEPCRIVLLTVGVLCLGAAFLFQRPATRVVVALLGLLAAGTAGIDPAWMTRLEAHAATARWRAFGVLPDPAAVARGAPHVRLIASRDTVYQNLAACESEGQVTLYGNGSVMWVFPDPIGYEHSVHFIMAQKPQAKTALLLGGNPVGHIPELLKYKLERLVWVELDPGIGELIRDRAPKEYETAVRDPCVTCVTEDAPRYVRRCRESFDVVLVNAPEPTTAAANRYYTREFFADIRRLLAPGGFMYTSVTSSERLQSEAADMGASVYQTLTSVFPTVLVTAEAQNRFFASADGELTFDRAILEARSSSADVKTQFFRPAYFRGAEEIDPEKVAVVKQRFSQAQVPLNTNTRPVSYFYNLVLWSRYSGSFSGPLLTRLQNADYVRCAGWIGLAGALCLFVGLLMRSAVRMGKRNDGVWSRAMASTLLASTGLCGMSLEVVLIFAFQSLFGYVYAMMGLIAAVFMLGLVTGAPVGRWLGSGTARRAWLGLGAVECLLAATAPAAWLVVSSDAGGGTGAWRYAAILVTVTLVGWCVGAEYPLVNRLFTAAGGSVGSAAAITDAADHLGAAVGSLFAGVLLVPVAGLGVSCMLLGAVKAASLLLLVSAAIALPPGVAEE